jgi:hypothetical protein
VALAESIRCQHVVMPSDRVEMVASFKRGVSASFPSLSH